LNCPESELPSRYESRLEGDTKHVVVLENNYRVAMELFRE